jgi:hypothetical protein
MRLLLLLTATLTLGAAPIDARAGFEAMKKLEGSWKQTSADGSITYLNLSVVSSGSAILEQRTGKDRSKISAVSVYHLDGDQLVMQHYGAQGNQPRMRAKQLEANRIRFETYEVLNLKTPTASHMSGVTFTFKDSDHLTQEWTQKEGGKESKIVFELQREYVDTLK